MRQQLIAAIGGAVMAVSAIVGFLVLDSNTNHMIIPDVGELRDDQRRLEASVSQIEEDVSDASRDAQRAKQDADRVSGSIAGLRADVGDQNLTLIRLASMWAIETLLLDRWTEAGGVVDVVVSGSDSQVLACVDYVLEGSGSFTDCGFEHAE